MRRAAPSGRAIFNVDESADLRREMHSMCDVQSHMLIKKSCFRCAKSSLNLYPYNKHFWVMLVFKFRLLLQKKSRLWLRSNCWLSRHGNKIYVLIPWRGQHFRERNPEPDPGFATGTNCNPNKFLLHFFHYAKKNLHKPKAHVYRLHDSIKIMPMT